MSSWWSWTEGLFQLTATDMSGFGRAFSAGHRRHFSGSATMHPIGCSYSYSRSPGRLYTTPQGGLRNWETSEEFQTMWLMWIGQIVSIWKLSRSLACGEVYSRPHGSSCRRVHLGSRLYFALRRRSCISLPNRSSSASWLPASRTVYSLLSNFDQCSILAPVPGRPSS